MNDIKTLSYMEEVSLSESIMYVMESVNDNSYQISKENINSMYNGYKYGNVEILTESVTSLKDSAVKFFKMVIKKIKELFAKVMMKFNKYFMSVEKFIKTYKKEIEESNPSFTVNGYEYTFDSSLPRTEIVETLVREYNEEVHDLMQQTKGDLVRKNLDKIQNGHMEIIRGNIIGIDSPIDSSEILKLYRVKMQNGNEDSSDILIDKFKYLEYVKSYPDLKKSAESLRKEKDRVLSVMNNLEQFFSNSRSITYDKYEKQLMTREIMISSDSKNITRKSESEKFNHTDIEKISTFFTHKWDECRHITTALTIALTAKMDTMNEAITMSKNIIFDGMKASNRRNEEVF